MYAGCDSAIVERMLAGLYIRIRCLTLLHNKKCYVQLPLSSEMQLVSWMFNDNRYTPLGVRVGSLP